MNEGESELYFIIRKDINCTPKRISIYIVVRCTKGVIKNEYTFKQ